MDHTNIGARFELPCSRCIHVAVFGSFKQAQQFTTQRISPVKICQNMSKWQSLRYTPFSNRPNLAAIVTQPFWVQMLQSPDALALMRLAAGSHSTKHHWLACWDSHASPLFHVTLFQLDLDVPALLSANGKLWLFQPSWYRHGEFTHQLPDPETQTLLHQEISRGYIGAFPNVYFREIWSRLCSIIHPASRGVAAHTAGLFRSVRGAKGGFPLWGLPKLRIFTFPPWGLPKLGNFHFSPPWGLPKLGNFHFSPRGGSPS